MTIDYESPVEEIETDLYVDPTFFDIKDNLYAGRYNNYNLAEIRDLEISVNNIYKTMPEYTRLHFFNECIMIWAGIADLKVAAGYTVAPASDKEPVTKR